jgi:hypothetical protein
MKRHVQKNKEKEEAQNNVVLNGIVLLHPLDTQRQGKKKFLSHATPLSSLSLSPPSPLAQILTPPTPLTRHHDED